MDGTVARPAEGALKAVGFPQCFETLNQTGPQGIATFVGQKPAGFHDSTQCITHTIFSSCNISRIVQRNLEQGISKNVH